jgi:hypothetical protein
VQSAQVSAKVRAITRAASGAVCAPWGWPYNGQASAGKRGTLNLAVGGRGIAMPTSAGHDRQSGRDADTLRVPVGGP